MPVDSASRAVIQPLYQGTICFPRKNNKSYSRKDEVDTPARALRLIAPLENSVVDAAAIRTAAHIERNKFRGAYESQFEVFERRARHAVSFDRRIPASGVRAIFRARDESNGTSADWDFRAATVRRRSGRECCATTGSTALRVGNYRSIRGTADCEH